jgi:hypothetical protein
MCSTSSYKALRSVGIWSMGKPKPEQVIFQAVINAIRKTLISINVFYSPKTAKEAKIAKLHHILYII